jgi:UDP-N-acetylmuramate dehydrogenase
MHIAQNISLKPFNTFGINANAKYFASFKSLHELEELLSQQLSTNNQQLILGGGSNILLTKNFDGIVLKNELKGIELVKEDAEFFYVKANAGEQWHSFVLHCIENNYAGIENLSLIPGCVGASPMQNIGAYGVEIKDVFEELEAFHLHEKKIVKFNINECAFDYRESVFKRKYKNEFVILNVTFRLRKHPVFNTSYGAIENELEKMNVKELSIRAISQAVINIRSSKLPDPKVIGNAGSFFKNPEIATTDFDELKKHFPEIIGYPVSNHQPTTNNNQLTKLAAGWLIEQCGWKGFRDGDAGCHAKQALVLVNYSNATGEDIFKLSEKIIKSVKEKFGVQLEREVNII